MAHQFICANWTPDRTDCKKSGTFTCKNCHLVLYCGANCQKSHWPIHKKDCKSDLSKATWEPSWVLEKRTPAFIGGERIQQFGGQKYLWGNVPAYDVLQLETNEGRDYGKDLHLLFAASGDIRNVAETIANIPSCYYQSVQVTMNDRDIDIVARNAIMILIAFVVDDIDKAIDSIIHVWYSALIRESDFNILQQLIRPLIEDTCCKIRSKGPQALLSKTWTFGERSLRLVLEKSAWDKLLSFMDIPAGLTLQQADRVRTAVTLAESRKDYIDRHMLFQSPSHRVAMKRFRKDGLLLPFGALRDEFRFPNPTFFQTADSWQMKDNADPLNGWHAKEVREHPSGLATADIYGKLFYHIRAVLRDFVNRMSDLSVSFQLFQVDASDLPNRLKHGSFSRIEVSNIADGGYLGIHRTVALLGPLLQSPSINPHATLITLFMNVVDENISDQDQIADTTPLSPTTKRLLKYLPFHGMPSKNIYDPRIIKFNLARSIVANYDYIFDRFVKNAELSKFEPLIGFAMKEKNTIVEKWPFRLKLQPGQPGAQEEFDRLLSGGVSGKEIYLEWKRTRM